MERRKPKKEAQWSHDGNARRYFLDPGFLFFSTQETIVMAVLGCSVGLCLWDKRLCYGGMSHFILPTIRDPKKATPRYGNVSVTALIDIMDKAGCRRQDLEAHLLGGAKAPAGTMGVSAAKFYMGFTASGPGPENIQAALRTLKRKSIPLISEDFGGGVGRKVAFDIGSGQVAVIKTKHIRKGDWLPTR